MKIIKLELCAIQINDFGIWFQWCETRLFCELTECTELVNIDDDPKVNFTYLIG